MNAYIIYGFASIAVLIAFGGWWWDGTKE